MDDVDVQAPRAAGPATKVAAGLDENSHASSLISPEKATTPARRRLDTKQLGDSNRRPAS
jgi:hypothetical protein